MQNLVTIFSFLVVEMPKDCSMCLKSMVDFCILAYPWSSYFLLTWNYLDWFLNVLFNVLVETEKERWCDLNTIQFIPGKVALKWFRFNIRKNCVRNLCFLHISCRMLGKLFNTLLLIFIIYNIVLVSHMQQSESVIHKSTLF